MKNSLNRLIFWCYALNKRLLKRPSFIIILLLIPIFTLSMSRVATEESGFVRIAVCALDKGDAAATAIIEELKKDNKMTVITECENESEARSLVEQGKVDTAWILLDNLESRADKIGRGESEQLVRIYMTEENTFVRAAREKLLGMFFPLVSYEIYENAALKLPLPPEYKTSEAFAEAYHIFEDDVNLIEYTYLDSNQSAPTNYDFLTAPLRGLLCTVMLLCGLAAALFFNCDDREGIFANLTAGRRAAVFIANNLAALTLSGFFVSMALMLSGLYGSFWYESLSMLLYILAATGFCTLIGALLKSPAKLSVAFPIVLILSIAMSPVFFNMRRLALVQGFFPLYHYLYGMNNPRFIISLGFLAVFYLIAAAMLYTHKNQGYIKEK